MASLVGGVRLSVASVRRALFDKERSQAALGRAAPTGLATVLLCLAAFTFTGAAVTSLESSAARRSANLAELYDQAQHALAEAEEAEQRYLRRGSASVSADHAAAMVAFQRALRGAQALEEDPEDQTTIQRLLTLGSSYEDVVRALFALVDEGHVAEAEELEQRFGHPVFDQLQAAIGSASDRHRDDALATLARLDGLARTFAIATPIALGLGIALLVLFWQVLRLTERRLREAGAREIRGLEHRERRFRSLVQNASDVIAVVDPDGRFSYLSPAGAERWARTDPSGKPVGSLTHVLHPDDAERATALLRRTAEAASGTVIDAELRLRAPDGSYREFAMSGANLLGVEEVAGLVLNARDVSAQKEYERQLSHQAFHDALTGLPNRALFLDRVTHALTRATRGRDGVAVIYVDLDEFKSINDGLGHAAGDQALRVVGERLLEVVREMDTAARLGGDEFAILAEGLGPSAATDLVERLLSALRSEFTHDGRTVPVRASIGMTLSPGGSQVSAPELLRQADIALYRAKRSGRDRWELFDESMSAELRTRLTIASDLTHALERRELAVHYQPIVDLETGRVHEVEALLRWSHPVRGSVPPADFVPVAEDSGVIVTIGRWALTEACRQVARWRRAGHDVRLSVNVSGRQLHQPALVQQVLDTLDRTGFAPTALTLEITETALIERPETAAETLAQLRAHGIHIALDDFGAGYSGIPYLRRFPVDTLKLDASFLRSIGPGAQTEALVEGIVHMATNLGLTVTAEGIETEEQLGLLKRLRCPYGQGYLLGRPGPPAEVAALLWPSQTAAAPAAASFDAAAG